MKQRYRFEIVRRAFGRFGWVVVERDRRGRHVVARSERSYRSKKRAKRAIAALGGAQVVDTTRGRSTPRLPATSFRVLDGVVPLIVEESPGGARRGGRDRARRRTPDRARRRNRQTKAA